jgi:hypothetical protein
VAKQRPKWGGETARSRIQAAIWPKKGSRPSTFVLRPANDYPLRPKSSIEEAFDHDEAGDSDSDFDFLFH